MGGQEHTEDAHYQQLSPGSRALLRQIEESSYESFFPASTSPCMEWLL